MLFQSLILPLLAISANSLQAEAQKDGSPIVISEFGTSPKYSLSKTMTCRDIEWHVHVNHNANEKRLDGDIFIKMAGKGHYVNEAQAAIFERIGSFDSVSSTCNHHNGQKHSVSHLLMTATDKQSGEYLLIRVYVNRAFDVEIRVTPTS